MKEGKWLITEYKYFDCSVCGGYYNRCESRHEVEESLHNRPGDVYNYCPWCGAKMTKGD